MRGMENPLKLYIQMADEPPQQIVVTDKAMAKVRASFNPSGRPDVDMAKLLCAAPLTEAEHAATGEDSGDEERRLSLSAAHYIETGAMFIVKALTTPPPVQSAPAIPAQQ